MVKREPSQLDAMLAEGVQAAKKRERTAFDHVVRAEAGRIVLFGAGGLGRRMLRSLRAAGVAPLAFADSQPRLWGTYVDGVEVRSPHDAVREFGADATFVVTIWGAFGRDRMGDRIRALRELGCDSVTSFLPLAWKYPVGMLPHYGADLPHRVHDAAADVLAANELWADAASRAEYARQIRWRLLGDFDALSDPVAHPIYFPHDLCVLRPDETFVDCGAYDGDTARLFAREAGAFRKIVAFEPDDENFARLARTLGALRSTHEGDAVAIRAATGARRERLRFIATGSAMSAVGDGDGDGDVEVESLALDEALAGDEPTFVKMDIEGSELEALAGARRIIAEHEPVLAISCYHRQEHLWQIPLLIARTSPNYRFYLRPHDTEMWDLVCYAIPASRWRA